MRLSIWRARPDPANDGGIVQACAFASGKSFENGAGRVELLCFLEADGADDGTAMGTVLTRPSASSSRSASRIDGRLTPVISQSSRSIRRWPGFRFRT
jgi:hypothetical protein